jgi:ATP-dependent exoDNAse (exonuclease V) beta subunit
MRGGPAADPLARIARFDRDLVVQAGAGTGKTHALVTLYLHLVAGRAAQKEPIAPARLAVVTFTDKAAGELRERIRARLTRLAEAAGDRTVEPTLLAAEGPLVIDPAIARRARAAVLELGPAPIGTYHAFCGALLRRYAARAGIDPDFVLSDEAQGAGRASLAIERTVLGALDRDDHEVARLVEEFGYRARGRGRALVEHLAYLRAVRAEQAGGGLGETYAPDRVAAELREAVRALVRAVDEIGAAATDLAKGSQKNAREMVVLARALEGDGVRSEGLLERVAPLVELRKKLKSSGTRSIDTERETLKVAELRVEDAHAQVRAAPFARTIERLLGEIEERYTAQKRSAGVLDFSDLLVLARDLLRDQPQVRTEVQGRFDAVLVDEFQDTNEVQAELIELVAGPPDPAGPGRRFVVGDRKQAIYEFRGADVAVFTHTTSALVAGGAEEAVLCQSRRAAPSVLALANGLFARVMSPRGDDTQAAWQLRFDPEKDALSSFRDESDDPGCELLTVLGEDSAATRVREARAIGVRIRQLHAAGRAYGQVAVLLRRFTHLSVYLDGLRRAEVPYFVVRGRGFFAAQEVRDLAAALTLLDDPDDRMALVAVLRSPLCGVSDETLARLALDRRLRTAALLDPETDFVRLLGDTAADEAERLVAFAARFRELRLTADRLGAVACTETIVEGVDYRAVLAAGREGEQRIANLDRLVERAREHEAQGGDLRAFVGWLRRLVGPAGDVDSAQAQVVDERDDVVRVMTVHQSKGLEFPVVFVPACGSLDRVDVPAVAYDPDAGLGLRILDEREPSRRMHTTASRRVTATREARVRAESLRLFYVATTRARDRVIFSGEAVSPTAETWRTHLDRVVGDPRSTSLLTVVDGDALSLPPRPRVRSEQLSLLEPPLVAMEVRRLPVLDERPVPRARSLTCAVTQLSDFQVCPRRYHQFHELDLMEHPAEARAPSAELMSGPLDGSPDALPLDPLRRGTLAHRLLERCDLGAGGADLEALVTADGYDPKDEAVIEVCAHVRGFLGSRFGRGLSERAVRRELPFLVAQPIGPGAHLYLRGQIDLLLLDPDGVTVIDYKHARRGDPDDYRFQLDAYALAVRRLYPRAPTIRVGLAFLKEADPSPELAMAGSSERFERELSALGGALLDARARERWDGRPVEVCRRIHCGYVYRCHPQAA